MKFSNYIVENRADKKTITFVDVANTLFIPKKTVSVLDIKTGNLIAELTKKQFEEYVLQPGQKFDFKRYDAAEKFPQSLIPPDGMIEKIRFVFKEIFDKTDVGFAVMILPPRKPFANEATFISKMKDWGIDILSSIEKIEMIGDERDKPVQAAIRVQLFVKEKLSSGGFRKAQFFSDKINNLKAFSVLAEDFGNVELKAFQLNAKELTIKEYIYNAENDGKSKIEKT